MNEGTSGNAGGLVEFLDFGFTKFITLKAIKVLYVLGLILLVLGWLGFSLVTMLSSFVAGVGVFIGGALAVVVYAILLRIWLEMIAVIFRIGENTTKLVEQGHRVP